MAFLTSSSELFKGINTLENTIAKVRRQVETVLEEIDRQLSSDQTHDTTAEDGRNNKIYKDRLQSDLRCFLMSFPQMCHLISSISEGFRHIHPERKWEARKEENDALDVVIKLEPDRDRDDHDDAVFEMLQVTPELGETDEEMHGYNQPNQRSSTRPRQQTQESGSLKQLKNLLHRPIQKTKPHKNHSPTSEAGNSKQSNLQRNGVPATVVSSDNAQNNDNHDNFDELKGESESETNEIEELSGDESSDFEFEIIDFGAAKFPSPKQEDSGSNFPAPKEENSGNNNETMKDYRDEYEKCCHCTSAFRNKHQLRQHVMMIHPRSYFKEYGKNEETEEDWVKFMNITPSGTVDEDYPFKCPICEKPFRQKKIVLEHIPSHCGISEQKLTCPECNNIYKTPMSLRAHLRHQHPRRHNQQQQQQQKHQSESSSIPITTTCTSNSDTNNAQPSTKSVHCPICGQLLSSRYNLKQHMLRHDGSKPFVCPFPGCGKTFRQQGSVRNHVEGIHSVTEKYVCKMCDKKFRWRRCYDIHVQTHNENRVKMLCTFCSKEFLCDQYLQNHIASVHLKLRSYPCHLCEKSFAHKSNLVYHLNTHERDKNKIARRGVSLVGQV